MHYTDPRFTYLLTYDNGRPVVGVSSNVDRHVTCAWHLSANKRYTTLYSSLQLYIKQFFEVWPTLSVDTQLHLYASLGIVAT